MNEKKSSINITDSATTFYAINIFSNIHVQVHEITLKLVYF